MGVPHPTELPCNAWQCSGGTTVQCSGRSAVPLHPYSEKNNNYYNQRQTVQYSTVQYSTVQHSTAQHSTAQHSTAQHSTAQHSTAQRSTVQYSFRCKIFLFFRTKPAITILYCFHWTIKYMFKP